MKKIAIVGTSVYGIENMGDEALLAVLCRELHVNIKDLEITWIARHPDQSLAALYNIQKVIKNLDHDNRKESLGRYFLGLNQGDSTENLREIAKTIEACDLLIVGGDPFNEIALGVYRGLAPQAALYITLAKFMQKPVMLYSIHMGRELKTEVGRELTKYCVENSTLVTLREEFSRDVLKKMGIKVDNTVVLADTVWGIETEKNTERALQLLSNENIKLKNDKVLGVNFRHNYWEWKEETWRKLSDEIAAFCDYVIAEYGFEILMIPNCTYDLDAEIIKYQDDRPTHKDIFDKIKHHENVSLIEKKLNLYETISLFSLLNMHFSNRRHSLIFAAAHKVPVIATGGEWHIKPSMEDINIGEYFLPIQELTFEHLKDRFDAIWSDKETIQVKIGKALPGLYNTALKHAVEAAKLV